MNTATEPVWLKVGQVAKALQLSESSVYRMVRSGEIPVRWVGGRVRIHRNFIEEEAWICLLYTSPSPRDQRGYRIPSSA